MTDRMKTILVCDDDPDMLALLTGILEHHGYRVRSSTFGRSALSIAAEEAIDLVVMDLLMPHMGGWEVVAALRSDPATQKIPIVVISSLSPNETEVAARSVQGWVTKPIEETELLTVVEQVLKRPAAETPRVLVVEDNDATAAVLQTLLERHGMSYFRAKDGVEAIEVASWCRPDLLVLDVLLPEMDGYSVVKWLRKHDQLRTTPVIVYSGANISEADRDRLELGRTEFIPKGQFPVRAVEQKALQILAGLLTSTKIV